MAGDLKALVAEALPPAGVAVAEGDEQVGVDDPFGNRVELLERGGTLVGPP